MPLEDLFFKAEEHHKTQRPFVLYRKPHDDTVIGVFQKSAEVLYTKDFTETGFVFSPFDDIKKTIVFEQSSSETNEVTFNLEDAIFKEYVNGVVLIEPSSESIDEHVGLVNKGIETIKTTDLEKVVLSREFDFDTDASAIDIFKRLLVKYPTAFTYLWYHPKVGLWLGATPETLLSIAGLRFKTMSLAGTQPYRETLDVNWGAKEQQEQHIVTESIIKALEEEARQLLVSKAETSRAGAIVHLKSEISGDFKADFNLKTVLKKLHPTPAVCGFPRDLAKSFILENEMYTRDYYTGFLGELNKPIDSTRSATKRNLEHSAYRRQRGITNLYVNLRCMKLVDSTAYLFVGGGITADSDAGDEFWEIHNKLNTILSVL